MTNTSEKYERTQQGNLLGDLGDPSDSGEPGGLGGPDE